MKFTVEVEDFYLNENSDSLEEELRKCIIAGVVDQIEKNLNKKIEEEITRIVRDQVSNNLTRKISAKVAELIELGEIQADRSGKMVKISDYIKQVFESNALWNSPYEKVAEIAKKWGDELRNRYDKAFAIHIVDQMKKNGLLKDEAIAKLLEQN